MTTRSVFTVKKKVNRNFWKHVYRGGIIFDQLLHGYMVLILLSQDYDYVAHLRRRLYPKYGYSEYLQWHNLLAEKTLYFYRSAKMIFNS